MRQLNLYPRHLLWLGTALVITALALVAPLSAATVSRRARTVHVRSQLGRGVQTSRLGISGDAIEGARIEAACSVVLAGVSIDRNTEPVTHAAYGVGPRGPGRELLAFVEIATGAIAPVHDHIIALAAPRGPPTA